MLAVKRLQRPAVDRALRPTPARARLAIREQQRQPVGAGRRAILRRARKRILGRGHHVDADRARGRRKGGCVVRAEAHPEALLARHRAGQRDDEREHAVGARIGRSQHAPRRTDEPQRDDPGSTWVIDLELPGDDDVGSALQHVRAVHDRRGPCRRGGGAPRLRRHREPGGRRGGGGVRCECRCDRGRERSDEERCGAGAERRAAGAEGGHAATLSTAGNDPTIARQRSANAASGRRRRPPSPARTHLQQPLRRCQRVDGREPPQPGRAQLP